MLLFGEGICVLKVGILQRQGAAISLCFCVFPGEALLAHGKNPSHLWYPGGQSDSIGLAFGQHFQALCDIDI